MIGLPRPIPFCPRFEQATQQFPRIGRLSRHEAVKQASKQASKHASNSHRVQLTAFVYDGQSSHGGGLPNDGICIGAEDRRPRPVVGCHDTALDQSGILPRRGKQRRERDLAYS